MVNRISGHHHPRNELFDFDGFHHRTSLQKVHLTIAFKKFPENAEVHLFKATLIISLHGQFTSELHFEGVAGSRMTDIMH